MSINKHISALIDNVNILCSALQQEVGPALSAPEVPLKDSIELYFLMRKLKEIGEDLAKIANVALPSLAGTINEGIEATGADKIEYLFEGDRYKLDPDIRPFISVKKELQESMLNFMKQHPVGKELVKETVHPKTFESFVQKEFIEVGKHWPDFVSVHISPTIKVRKLPKSTT